MSNRISHEDASYLAAKIEDKTSIAYFLAQTLAEVYEELGAARRPSPAVEVRGVVTGIDDVEEGTVSVAYQPWPGDKTKLVFYAPKWPGVAKGVEMFIRLVPDGDKGEG